MLDQATLSCRRASFLDLFAEPHVMIEEGRHRLGRKSFFRCIPLLGGRFERGLLLWAKYDFHRHHCNSLRYDVKAVWSPRCPLDDSS